VSGFSARRASPIIGLVSGLALGLVYTWVIVPVELVNTQPVLLRTDHRGDWVRLVALSYVADGDLERARTRLDGLRNEDVAEAMQALIEEFAAAGRSADTLRRLATLAQALNVHTPAMLVYLHTPGSQLPPSTHTPSPMYTSTPTPAPPDTPTARASPTSPSPTLEPTFTPTFAPHDASSVVTPTSESTSTPSPSPTPTPPLLARLQLAQREQICRPGQVPRIEVIVRDENGVGLSGVTVWLTWPGGADRAVTGLKPQRGAGYADFNAEQGVSYALGIGELGVPLASDLRIEPCPADADQEPPMGSWLVVLEPRRPDGE
jgi:hypothetical protein